MRFFPSLQRWLRRLAPRRVSSYKTGRLRCRQLGLERLESREVPATGLGGAAALSGFESLRRSQDQYHERFGIYEDVSSAGNHFHVFAQLGTGVSINGSWTDNPHSGATAIRASFTNLTGVNFGGYYLQNGILPDQALVPQANWGTVPNAGIDLHDAISLTYWARGQSGNEKIECFLAGVGRDAVTGVPTEPFPDSSPRRPSLGTITTLTNTWQQYTIDLTGMDLSYVLGGFAWVANAPNNPTGAVFFLDDISIQLSPARTEQRLNSPHFLRSYTTLPVQSLPAPVDDFDLALRNTAFTYDNALAALAFLADGGADSLRRARLIGDAFVYASQHDRFYNDGRLRSAYAAGDLALPPGWTPNNRIGTAAIPGFYTEFPGVFHEIGQESVDVGNNAWAMIALLALYRRTGDSAYLATARTLGNFIDTFRNTTGTFQGFQGGIDAPESANPIRRPWASTEHNLDVYAAFTTMFALTGESIWQTGAFHARTFVEAMWDEGRGCYLTGTTNPEMRNTTPGQLPLDVQAWSVLALPDALTIHPQLLACAEANHRTTSDGFTGYDFNEDKDGVWFEGTAQMATAYAWVSQQLAAEPIREELRRAMRTPGFGAGGSLVAASHDGLTTGFGFFYHRRFHIAATAWNIFAQLEFNPYRQTIRTFQRADIAGRVAASGEWWVAESDGTRFVSRHWGEWSNQVVWLDVLVADVNGDGRDDRVGRVGSSGQWWVALSTGSQLTNQLWGGWAPITWIDVRAADVNGDGRDDLLGRTASGQWWVALSDGTRFINQLWGSWSVIPTWVEVQIADVNRDGRSDIVGRYLQTGQWWVALSTGTQFNSQLWETWSNQVAWTDVLVADVNGDGRDDIAGRVASTGEWWVALSTGAQFASQRWTVWNATATWIDVRVADVNGDGREDIVGRHHQTGRLWVALSNGTAFINQDWGLWPSGTWVDVQSADVNGDGLLDRVGRNTLTGTWMVARSTGTQFLVEEWARWSTVVWVDVLVGAFAGSTGPRR